MQKVKSHYLLSRGYKEYLVMPIITWRSEFEVAGIASQLATQFCPVVVQCTSSVATHCIQV